MQVGQARAHADLRVVSVVARWRQVPVSVVDLAVLQAQASVMLVLPGVLTVQLQASVVAQQVAQRVQVEQVVRVQAAAVARCAPACLRE